MQQGHLSTTYTWTLYNYQKQQMVANTFWPLQMTSASATTVLHPTKNASANTVVKVLMEQYLPIYPDPDLIHSDGGTHFCNKIVEELTEARGIKHTICTPYAKWAHGVAEANNKRVMTILRTLCRKLGK